MTKEQKLLLKFFKMSEDPQAWQEVSAVLQRPDVLDFNLAVLSKIYGIAHNKTYNPEDMRVFFQKEQQICFRHKIMKHIPFAAPYIVAALDTQDYPVQGRGYQAVFDCLGTQTISYKEDGQDKTLTLPISRVLSRTWDYKRMKPGNYRSAGYEFPVSESNVLELTGKKRAELPWLEKAADLAISTTLVDVRQPNPVGPALPREVAKAYQICSACPPPEPVKPLQAVSAGAVSPKEVAGIYAAHASSPIAQPRRKSPRNGVGHCRQMVLPIDFKVQEPHF